MDVYKLLHDVRKREGRLFKWYLTLEVTFRKIKNPNIVTDPPVYFKTHSVLLYMGDTSDTLQTKMKVLVEKIENYETTGSGWIVNGLVSLTVELAKVDNPLRSKYRESSSDDEDHQTPFEKKINL